MIDFGGVSLPFSAGDLIQSASDLLGVFGPFLLLGLALAFTPVIIRMIQFAIRMERLREEHSNNEGRKVSRREFSDVYWSGGNESYGKTMRDLRNK